MGRLKQRKKDEREIRIQDAIQHYNVSVEPCIRQSAESFGIAYSTLRGRLGRVQQRGVGHRGLQVLTEYEETAIVEWVERMDEWGHPPRLDIVKAIAQSLVRGRI